MARRKKLTREAKLRKQREAKRIQYQKIKNDPEKYELLKQKEREKYLKKKEKGIIKTIDDMTPREQRKARMIWRKKARERKQRLALQNATNDPVTPLISNVDIQISPKDFPAKVIAAKLKSDRLRRQKYLIDKKKRETRNKRKTEIATSSDSEEIITPKDSQHQIQDIQQPSTSQETLKNGDFILVKLFAKKTEYRYVALTTGLVEDDEMEITFCKIADKSGKLFKVDENDTSFISESQVIEVLPMPNIVLKGQRTFYSFKKSVDVFEKA